MSEILHGDCSWDPHSFPQSHLYSESSSVPNRHGIDSLRSYPRSTLTSSSWLMTKGRHADAFKSLLRLRGSKLLAARELYYVHAQMQAEELLVEKAGLTVHANVFTRMVELFTIPRIRRAVGASGIVMIAQQMCGSKSQDSITHFGTASTNRCGQSTSSPSIPLLSSPMPAHP